jgi:hypothetical protein
MPEILNLLTPLLLGSINRENLPKRVKKRAILTVASKKTKQNKTKPVPKGWCSKLGLSLRQS